MNIEAEMEERVKYFKGEDKLLEAQRIAERTNFDIEMLKETGFCSGIENYSRHLAGLPAGATPHTLMDYFKDDFLIIVDESHITIPQIGGMYAGDQSRKSTLVDYGFFLFPRHQIRMKMSMSYSVQSRLSGQPVCLILRW